jgi:hypothetical protein
MTEPLDDVWLTRDFPVLKEVTRRIDAGEVMPESIDIANALGIENDKIVLAAKALDRRGLVELSRDYGGDATFLDVSGEAYLLTGLHPNGEDALTGLVEALQQAADQVDDPEERSRLRRAAEAVRDVSRDIMTGVLTAYLTTRIPG